MKKFGFGKFAAVAAIIATIGFTTGARAALPAGYYNSLEGKSGVALKKAVKSVVRNHTAIPYGDDTWEVFIESDTRMVGGQRVWWDMYSPDNVAAPNASSHSGMNIEHSVANSWWDGAKNDAYKDIVHLNPSNSNANSRKSNYPLGEIAQETWSNGVTFVGKPKSGDCGGATYVYEPADEYKGDFARVFFYMFTIYDDISWKKYWACMFDTSSDLLLKPWAYEMLLRWAEQDPVSQKEIDRNEVIFKHQKNRNPFIDCPQLAQYIWGKYKNTPFHFDGTVDPGTEPDDPETPEQPDGPGTAAPLSGYWYAVTDATDLNESDSYVLVSTENFVAMSVELGSSGKFFQVCQGLPALDKSVTPTRLSSVPDDAAVLRLTKSGAGWTVNVRTLTEGNLGYLKSTENKSLTLTSNAAENGTTVIITPSAAKTDMQYNYSGSSKASYIYYNSSAPRFTTYNSTGQEPVMLYRLEDEHRGDTTGLATGLDETADEVITGIYDINGRLVSAGSVDDLDRGIYIVVSNFGTRKIRKL